MKATTLYVQIRFCLLYTSSVVGQNIGPAFLRSKTEAEADERRGFAVGAPARRSRDGNGDVYKRQAGAVLCSGKRAHQYPPAAGRGNCGGKGQGLSLIHIYFVRVLSGNSLTDFDKILNYELQTIK